VTVSRNDVIIACRDDDAMTTFDPPAWTISCREPACVSDRDNMGFRCRHVFRHFRGKLILRLHDRANIELARQAMVISMLIKRAGGL